MRERLKSEAPLAARMRTRTLDEYIGQEHIVGETKSHFTTISAILAGKADLRVVIDESLERRRLYNIRTILFLKYVLETPI